MVPAPARDDLLLFGTSEDVVVIPDQLDVRLIGVRATHAKIHFGHVGGCAIKDHFRQCYGSFGAVAHV